MQNFSVSLQFSDDLHSFFGVLPLNWNIFHVSDILDPSKIFSKNKSKPEGTPTIKQIYT